MKEVKHGETKGTSRRWKTGHRILTFGEKPSKRSWLYSFQMFSASAAGGVTRKWPLNKSPDKRPLTLRADHLDSRASFLLKCRRFWMSDWETDFECHSNGIISLKFGLAFETLGVARIVPSKESFGAGTLRPLRNLLPGKANRLQPRGSWHLLGWHSTPVWRTCFRNFSTNGHTVGENVTVATSFG